jgi:hypothetical protein
MTTYIVPRFDQESFSTSGEVTARRIAAAQWRCAECGVDIETAPSATLDFSMAPGFRTLYVVCFRCAGLEITHRLHESFRRGMEAATERIAAGAMTAPLSPRAEQAVAFDSDAMAAWESRRPSPVQLAAEVREAEGRNAPWADPDDDDDDDDDDDAANRCPCHDEYVCPMGDGSAYADGWTVAS